MTALTALLQSRSLLRISGPDRSHWLQGLLTQNTLDLGPGELRFGALLSPQGKLLFDLFFGASEDSLMLDVEAKRRDLLLHRLMMYRLRADVAITAIEGPTAVWAQWGDGAPPEGSCWRRDPRLPGLGWRAWSEELSATASESQWSAHCLALGVPDPARDTVPDQTWPIEADFDLLNGIDFGKGCFVGQETTSRMKRRGQIRSRMLPIRFEGAPPAPGAEILAGELRAGEVLNGIEGRAMARVRLDRIAGADLTVEGRPVQADPPAWMDLN